MIVVEIRCNACGKPLDGTDWPLRVIPFAQKYLDSRGPCKTKIATDYCDECRAEMDREATEKAAP